jgi:hypothetical protein
MAKEIQSLGTTGTTLYAQVVRRSDGTIWNTAGTPAFENYATANIGDYDIAMTEAGTASGYFTGDFPTGITAAGSYSVVVRQRAGGSPAESDPAVAVGTIEWTGTASVGTLEALNTAIPGSPTADSINERIKTIDDAYTATRAGYLDYLNGTVPARLKKNTAFAKFMFYLEANDGTAATGKTVTATRSLDGAAFAACTNSVVEVASGWYYIDLAAGDLNGNSVAMRFTASSTKTRNIMVITQAAS